MDKKILLIEDEKILCQMYQMEFKQHGFDLAIAQGGIDGLEKIRKTKPDLVLLDIKMDDLDGLEVLKRVKDNPETKHIPIILLTNVGEEVAGREGLELGAEKFILKTKITPHELVKLVKERLGV